ncbi:MAG TPA: hypothetical protein VFD36_08865 [Kofleriaceae bacterium]|nr:hypothetical protein [Kofleriaceae bacterium]
MLHARMAYGGNLGALVGGLRARYLPGVAFDPRRRVLVVFGGGDPSGSALFSDTWEFDGTAWHQR